MYVDIVKSNIFHLNKHVFFFLLFFLFIPLLPNATFTPSIQSNLGLPRTRPPLTSAINTLLAIR